MATVVRFRHGLARMTAVLGEHGMSHRTHSSGLHDAPSHQVCLLRTTSPFVSIKPALPASLHLSFSFCCAATYLYVLSLTLHKTFCSSLGFPQLLVLIQVHVLSGACIISFPTACWLAAACSVLDDRASFLLVAYAACSIYRACLHDLHWRQHQDCMRWCHDALLVASMLQMSSKAQSCCV